MLVGDDLKTDFGFGFDHIFSTTTLQGPRSYCQSPGTVADTLFITRHHLSKFSSWVLIAMPLPCPFPITREGWVSLPIAWCNSRLPFSAPRHLLIIFHPPRPPGPGYTRDMPLQPPVVTYVWTPACVNTPQKGCHSCLDT